MLSETTRSFNLRQRHIPYVIKGAKDISLDKELTAGQVLLLFPFQISHLWKMLFPEDC